MTRNYEMEGKKMTAYMPKELDHHKAEELRSTWDMVLETNAVKELVFDFAKTEFMDSSGIGVVIGRSKKAGYFGGKSYAKNLNPRVKKLFLAAGLDTLVQVVEKEDSYEG